MQQLNTQISVIYLRSNRCLQAAPWLSIVLRTWGIREEGRGREGVGGGRPWGKWNKKEAGIMKEDQGRGGWLSPLGTSLSIGPNNWLPCLSLFTFRGIWEGGEGLDTGRMRLGNILWLSWAE